MEAGPTCGCLKVQFKQEDGTSYTMTTTGHLDFLIINDTNTAQDLTKLELKFYYLNEGVLTSPAMQCSSFSGGGCSVVSASFIPFTPTRPTADSVMKLAFSSGSIPSGGSVEVRLTISNLPSATFDETKFFSYTAADTSYTDAPNITLYTSTTLLWGTHP
jgi:hypothetical protein